MQRSEFYYNLTNTGITQDYNIPCAVDSLIFFLFPWPPLRVCKTLVPDQGLNPRSAKGQSVNHRTAKEVSLGLILKPQNKI